MTTQIRTIAGPRVYLVGRQQIDDAELDRFLADEGAEGWTTDTDVAAQVLSETAGRLCYKSYAKPRPGGNSAYLGHILGVGHGSVLEHAVFNLIVTGVSRSLTHELVRHRVGFGYSQRSQRYCDEAEGAFVVPPGLAEEVEAAKALIRRHFFQGDIPAGRVLGFVMLDEKQGPHYSLSSITKEERIGLQWLAAVEQGQATYGLISDYLTGKLAAIPDKTARRKQAREAARSVLPNAAETQIFVTGNARALRHFLESRGSAQADAEIRRLAVAMLGVLAKEAPNIFGDYHLDQINGEPCLTTPNPKV